MAGMLISLLIVLLILVIVCVIINNYVPLDPPIKQLIIAVIAIFCLIWIILILSGSAPLFVGGPRLR